MDTKPQPTVSIRITKKRYKVLRNDAKENGHSISWLLNYIVDLYYQEQGKDSLTGEPLAVAARQKGKQP